MAIRGVCPDMACELYDSERAKGKIKFEAAKIVAEQLGLPTETIRTIIKRNLPSGSNEPTNSQEKYETCAISDLQVLLNSNRKFNTIMADPPWKYSNQATRSSTDNHYKTLSVAEICELPIAGLGSENAHLHLWTTNAFLFAAKEVMETWGFEYKSCFVWVKPQMGMGNYWRLAHEFLLLGVRGSCRFLDRGQMSWRQLERTKHSSKPEEIRKIIERVSPGPYLELFARKAAKGWVSWGNEIERNLFNEYAFADKRI